MDTCVTAPYPPPRCSPPPSPQVELVQLPNTDTHLEAPSSRARAVGAAKASDSLGAVEPRLGAAPPIHESLALGLLFLLLLRRFIGVESPVGLRAR